MEPLPSSIGCPYYTWGSEICQKQSTWDKVEKTYLPRILCNHKANCKACEVYLNMLRKKDDLGAYEYAKKFYTGGDTSEVLLSQCRPRW